MARYARWVLVALALGLGLLGPVSAASAASAASGSVTVKASIDGHAVAGKSSVKLKPSSAAQVGVTITNGTDRSVSIRTVRLEGRVIGLVFYAYDTSVVVDLAPGASVSRTLTIDTSDLGSQAVGLIPSQVQVLDQHRTELASQDLTVDVRGSLWSLYGLFGLVILVVTIAWTVNVAQRLFRGVLPENRWLRATRFLVPGLGIGLVFVFTLSALRVVAPTASLWVPVVFGAAVIMFVLGYLSPTPDSEHDDDDESSDDDVVAAATTILPGESW